MSFHNVFYIIVPKYSKNSLKIFPGLLKVLFCIQNRGAPPPLWVLYFGWKIVLLIVLGVFCRVCFDNVEESSAAVSPYVVGWGSGSVCVRCLAHRWTEHLRFPIYFSYFPINVSKTILFHPNSQFICQIVEKFTLFCPSMVRCDTERNNNLYSHAMSYPPYDYYW